jgi:rRNA maturation endonuclease Nob1
MSFTDIDAGEEDFDLEGLDDTDGGDQEIGEVEEGSPDEPEVAEPSHLDVDTYGAHLVPVKIDGETHMVPLSEVQGGYQRQADYTRKAQEVAAQRQEASSALALMAAYRQDPQGTLAAMAQEAGIEFTRPDAEELSPIEAQIREINVWRHRQEVDAEVARLALEYGDLFDPSEAVAYAITNNYTVTQAAKSLAADKLLAERARNASQAQRQAEDKTRTEAKRSSQVAGGHSAKGGKATLDINSLSTAELMDAIENGLIK